MTSERLRSSIANASVGLALMSPSLSIQEQSSVLPKPSSISQSEQSFLGLPLEAPKGKREVATAVVAPGIQDKAVIKGLAAPTALRFSRDGSLLVAEKRGTIKRYKTVADTSPVTVTDLGPRVMNNWDRGLLGIETDPRNPNRLYALYTVDAPVGQEPPVHKDDCADRIARCVVDGELDRLTLDPSTKKVTKRETILRNKFPQQYSSHSVGTVRWGPDNNLYITAGEGAAFDARDYGQTPSIPPMGDAPGQGGALRAQTMRTFDGGVTRVNPDTGKAATVSKGMRNPFRAAFRPGTKELWSGDVGWNTWEEINRDTNVTDAGVTNFGWPCYEGSARQPSYDAANLGICEGLYVKGPTAVAKPYFQYGHVGKSAAISGLAFTTGTAFPPEYRGLWYADYGQQKVSLLGAGINGTPDPSRNRTILTAVMATDLQFGPNGRLYYPDIAKGEIHEVSTPTNHDPQAVIKADKKFGPLPLTVTMNCNDSLDSDPGDTARLTCEWDTDGNGSYDTRGKVVTKTYTAPANVPISLRVTDGKGGVGTVLDMLYPGDTPPEPNITTPANGRKYVPGQRVVFSGSASDREEGQIPVARIKWKTTIYHCPAPTDCHPHELSETIGTGGSFTFPEHGSPAEYRLRLTQIATDTRGLAARTGVDLFKQ